MTPPRHRQGCPRQERLARTSAVCRNVCDYHATTSRAILTSTSHVLLCSAQETCFLQQWSSFVMSDKVGFLKMRSDTRIGCSLQAQARKSRPSWTFPVKAKERDNTLTAQPATLSTGRKVARHYSRGRREQDGSAFTGTGKARDEHLV